MESDIVEEQPHDYSTHTKTWRFPCARLLEMDDSSQRNKSYLLLNLGNNVNTGIKVSPALECRKHSIVT